VGDGIKAVCVEAEISRRWSRGECCVDRQNHNLAAAQPMSLPANKTYMDLACEAILALHTGESSSASLAAIKQHIQNQYPDLELKNVWTSSSSLGD
jgi:hypothetical protein